MAALIKHAEESASAEMRHVRDDPLPGPPNASLSPYGGLPR